MEPQEKTIKRLIAKKMLEFVWIIFVVNALALVFHWYWIYWWFDMPMHFLGGIFIGFLMLYIFPNLLQNPVARNIFYFFILAFIIGFGWEVFEWSMDHFIKHIGPNVLDTMSDLFFDLSGGGVVYLYFLFKNPIRKQETSVYSK